MAGVVLAMMVAACSGTDPATVETPTAATSAPATASPITTTPSATPAPPITTAPSTTAPSTTAGSSTTASPTTAAPATTDASKPAPRPFGELFDDGPVAWSLLPRFGAAGTAMPIAVEVSLDPGAIESIQIVDRDTEPLATLDRASGRFWNGEIPAGLVAGEQLSIRSVTRLGDGTTIESDDVIIPLLASTGTTLRPVTVDVAEELVHPADGPELGIEYPEFEGEVTTPASVAAVSTTEIAVVDTANRRVVCFDLTGATTCDIALARFLDGDLMGLGDGTLALVDFENVDGAQAVALYRIDPAANTAEVIFEESPLQVDGFGGIAHNSVFSLDTTTGTAWVMVPEFPESRDAPDPARFLWADAFRLATPVTRGPTVARPAFRADVTDGSISVVDGGAWATFDGIGGTPGTVSVLASATTPAGAAVLLVARADEAGSTAGIVRWVPGEPTYQWAPIEYLSGSGARVLDVLDESRFVLLDQGTRVRVLTLLAG